MARRVSFSGENLSISQAATHHSDVDSSLKLFFSNAAGYKTDEVSSELGERLAELDRNTTMSLLAAVEAAFRIDYLQRCYRKGKDNISREFLAIYKGKETRASLEDDIFEVWKHNTSGSTKIISDLRGAFKFRHWMAHGRYWTPKLGKKFDYVSVYPLAFKALSSFPLMAP